MSDQDIEAKFLRLTEPVMGQTRADNALSRLWHLEEIENAQEIMALFVLDSTQVLSRSPGIAAPVLAKQRYVKERKPAIVLMGPLMSGARATFHHVSRICSRCSSPTTPAQIMSSLVFTSSRVIGLW